MKLKFEEEFTFRIIGVECSYVNIEFEFDTTGLYLKVSEEEFKELFETFAFSYDLYQLLAFVYFTKGDLNKTLRLHILSYNNTLDDYIIDELYK